MLQLTALGLAVCDQIILDRDTQKPSLIGVFTGLSVNDFPSDPQRFSVAAFLTGGVGAATIAVRAVRLASGEQIYRQEGEVSFRDQTDIVNVLFRVRSIRFPEPGFYLFQLLVNDEPVPAAQRRLRVYRSPEQP
ncbi:MAG: hypothetical protein KY476_01080 [Planctomycetes bacterium]|nr:hypothetical protein [Planctomycetota bacterium]